MYQLTYDFLTSFLSGYADAAFISDLSCLVSLALLGVFVGCIFKIVFYVIKRCSP